MIIGIVAALYFVVGLCLAAWRWRTLTPEARVIEDGADLMDAVFGMIVIVVIWPALLFVWYYDREDL